jgi:hypothetical protein
MIDAYDAVILDDIGYVQQSRDEMEVLFTFLAERYERRSVIITSNVVFSEWDRIFKDPMTTAAAIDRVHHSVLLEMTGTSVRAAAADQAKKGVATSSRAERACRRGRLPRAPPKYWGRTRVPARSRFGLTRAATTASLRHGTGIVENGVQASGVRHCAVDGAREGRAATGNAPGRRDRYGREATSPAPNSGAPLATMSARGCDPRGEAVPRRLRRDPCNHGLAVRRGRDRGAHRDRRKPFDDDATRVPQHRARPVKIGAVRSERELDGGARLARHASQVFESATTSTTAVSPTV